MFLTTGKFVHSVSVFSIMTVLILHLSPVGRCVVKGRSVVRCTGWRTATCGAPPAAGKRPARDSPTKRLQADIAAHQQAAAFRQRVGGGASFCMHLVFLSSKSQLFVKALAPSLSLLFATPPNHSSCGRNQRTVESPFTLPTRIPSTAAPFSSFPVWETPVQLNSVMKRIDLKFCPVFYVGFSVASFYIL